MKFDYKIPLSHILLIGILLLLFVLGTYGYMGDSFNQTESMRFFSKFVLAAWLIFCFLSPRGRKIVIDEQGITVPNILLPPYRSITITWKEIQHVDSVFNQNMTTTLLLKTKSRVVKIHSWLFLADFEMAVHPKSFSELEVAVFDHVEP